MYQSEIVGIGPLALDFLAEKMLILYGANAPVELAEISVLHQHGPLEGAIEVGDLFYLGQEAYQVTAVGSEANHTFASMGHCSLYFGDKAGASLPGTIELKGKKLPEIQLCDQIQIIKGQKEA